MPMSSRPLSLRLSSLRAAGFGSALLTLAASAIVSPASAFNELTVGYDQSHSGTATITDLGTTASGTYAFNSGSPLDPTRTSYDDLLIYGPSTVNLNGGTITEALDTYDTSTVHVSSGNVSQLYADSQSTAYITGGSFGLIESDDNGNLYISGGNGSKIHVNSSGITHITGGSFDRLDAVNSGRADVTGGSFAYFFTGYGNDAINLFGTGFTVTPVDSSQEQFDPSIPQFRVQGTLQDGEPLNVYYIQQAGQLVLHDPVPEASSVISFGLLLTLGLGGLAVSARRRKAQTGA